MHGRDGSDPDLCDVCYWRKRAESRWIPVSERLPDTIRDVLVTAYTGHRDIGRYLQKTKVWVVGGCLMSTVTHWMELPDDPA